MFNGVNELRIDAIELSISVMAKANKNAGIKVPKKPESAIHFHSVLEIFLKVENPTKRIITPEIKIRKAPNCIGVKPIKAFFIKIKELPQIMESTIKNVHFLFFVNTLNTF